jgi:transcriptional regulator with XRE-family HTH domain
MIPIIAIIIAAERNKAMDQINYLWDTPSDVALRLAKKIKDIRKRKKITQKELAGRSNVSYATLRKFEKTGQISLESFIKLTMELGLIQEINNLFTEPVYSSIEEVINASK